MELFPDRLIWLFASHNFSSTRLRKVLDEALGLMRSLQMSSGTFRSRVLLKLCEANSQIKRSGNNSITHRPYTPDLHHTTP
jgi:hypothetical protein